MNVSFKYDVRLAAGITPVFTNREISDTVTKEELANDMHAKGFVAICQYGDPLEKSNLDGTFKPNQTYRVISKDIRLTDEYFKKTSE